MKKTVETLLVPIMVAAVIALPLSVFAADPLWVAKLSVSDDLRGSTTIDVVAGSEAECRSDVAAYRDAVVIEDCHPVGPSAITDDNDYNRTPPKKPTKK